MLASVFLGPHLDPVEEVATGFLQLRTGELRAIGRDHVGERDVGVPVGRVERGLDGVLDGPTERRRLLDGHQRVGHAGSPSVGGSGGRRSRPEIPESDPDAARVAAPRPDLVASLMALSVVRTKRYPEENNFVLGPLLPVDHGKIGGGAARTNGQSTTPTSRSATAPPSARFEPSNASALSASTNRVRVSSAPITLASFATTNARSTRSSVSRAASAISASASERSPSRSPAAPAVSVLKPTIGRSGWASRTASITFGVGSRLSVSFWPDLIFRSRRSTV